MPLHSYSPVSWAPWGISTAQDNPTSHRKQLKATPSWGGEGTLMGRAPLMQKALGARTAQPGRPAEGRRPPASRKAEGRARMITHNPLQMTLVFLLHPTHCWKEGLSTHCPGSQSKEIAGASLQGPPKLLLGRGRRRPTSAFSPSLI